MAKWRPVLVFVHANQTATILEPEELRSFRATLNLDEDSADDGSRTGLYHGVIEGSKPNVILALDAFLYTDEVANAYARLNL